MKTINEKWHEFEAAVVPKSAGYAQRVECKRMFFAGFAACFDMTVNDIGMEDSEDRAMQLLDSLRKQLLGFSEAVKMGAE